MRDIETIDAELRGAWLGSPLERMLTEHRGHTTSCSTSERQRSRLWAETETLRERNGKQRLMTLPDSAFAWAGATPRS